MSLSSPNCAALGRSSAELTIFDGDADHETEPFSLGGTVTAMDLDAALVGVEEQTPAATLPLSPRVLDALDRLGVQTLRDRCLVHGSSGAPAPPVDLLANVVACNYVCRHERERSRHAD